MANTLGATLMGIGVLALLGGLALVGFAEVDQGNNEEQAFSDDNEDRTDRNEQLRTGGFITAAVGAVLIVAGIIPAATQRAG